MYSPPRCSCSATSLPLWSPPFRDMLTEKTSAFRLILIAYWSGAYVTAPLHNCLACVVRPCSPWWLFLLSIEGMILHTGFHISSHSDTYWMNETLINILWLSIIVSYTVILRNATPWIIPCLGSLKLLIPPLLYDPINYSGARTNDYYRRRRFRIFLPNCRFSVYWD